MYKQIWIAPSQPFYHYGDEIKISEIVDTRSTNVKDESHIQGNILRSCAIISCREDLCSVELVIIYYYLFSKLENLSRFVIFSRAPRHTLGPTHPPSQWALGALSPGVKLPGREASHSSPSSSEVKHR
jgi:hypothetical protein